MSLYKKNYKNLKKLFLIGYICFFVLFEGAFAANVSSISQNTAINFGSIDALSGGVVNNCVASGPKILSGSGCTAASF
jgi:hypothetical protein